MKVNGTPYRTIWIDKQRPEVVQIIDQRQLPHFFVVEDLCTLDDFITAIREMHVRGAGLIGAAAGYAMYCACRTAARPGGESLASAAERLKAARPTAVNLAWAADRQLQSIAQGVTWEEKVAIACETAARIADEDAEHCRCIGEHGLRIIERLAEHRSPVNILTHCNAGWLAFVDYGSATAPIYAAHDRGIAVHVWVDETRPWNQGARLTAWELAQHGVPHTVIADNVGGHLMQHGMVDLVIVGSDRTTADGDVANKIGTYLKALAAKDNAVPFYAALPSSSFDWTMHDGVAEIPIEQRGGEEVRCARGLCDGALKEVLLTPVESRAANYSFDVTPARLVTGLITERGVCTADSGGIRRLFPEHYPQE